MIEGLSCCEGRDDLRGDLIAFKDHFDILLLDDEGMRSVFYYGKYCILVFR